MPSTTTVVVGAAGRPTAAAALGPVGRAVLRGLTEPPVILR